MPFIDIEFAEFAPDFGGQPPPDPRSAYLTEAENVYRVPGGYQVFPIPADGGGATLGASAVVKKGDIFENVKDDETSSWIFVGTDDTIFGSGNSGSTWTDVGRTTAYTSPVEWDFTRFDDDIIATDPGNAPQKKDAAAGATLTGLFSDLGGTPPQAKYCARVRDFLVLGNLSTGVNNVQWSAIGDHEAWHTAGTSTALSTQAGNQGLSKQYGEVKGLVGTETYGLVFQESAVTRMTYVGGDIVFDFDRITEVEGAGVYNQYDPIVQISEDLVVWRNHHGVFVTDGRSVRNVSDGKIQRALFKNSLGYANYFDFQGPASIRNYSCYDASLGVCVFPYVGPSNAEHILLYSPSMDSFSRVPDPTVQSAFAGDPSGSGVHRAFGFLGSNSTGPLYVFNSSSSIPVLMQTAYIELVPGKKVQIQGAHILGSNLAAPTISFKAADDFDTVDLDQTSFTNMTAKNRGIGADARDTARFFSFQVSGNQASTGVIRGLRVFYQEYGKL